ncbi:hypothetical protein [Ruania albidiflava]|uniref:hypothetical protein n=1 Tax=Ruania albidiflava TaxID=366586 RepID=UPI0003B63717|nr:hypothetical protein [Ruania albidiflava]
MLPFSPGPVPTTDEELTDRLARGLLTVLRPQREDTVRVSCTGTSAEHLAALHLDLDGAQLDPVAAQPPATSGTPVTVDHLTLTAAPVTVRGVRVQVTGELSHLPAAWTTDGAGLLWLLPQEEAAAPAERRAAGRVQVVARIADLEEALLHIGGPLLAQRGFTLTGVRLRIEAHGMRTARVHVQAQVRRGILSATVEGRGTASVDEAMLLTLSDLTVSSENALVSMGLAMIGRHLQAWEGRQIDLGAHLVGGLVVGEVDVDVAQDQVSVRARVGE